MMNYKKAISILIILGASLLTGCSNAINTTLQYENTIISENTENKYDINTIDFNLGDKIYKSSSGKEMPYKLRGTMSIPKQEGKFPVVFIVHGSHNNTEEDKRFDSGFKYMI